MLPNDRDAPLPPTADTAEMPRWLLQMRDAITIIGFVGALSAFVSYKLNLWLTPPAEQLSTIFFITYIAACAIFFYAVVFWAVRKSQLRDSLPGRLVLIGMVCMGLSMPFILAIAFAALLLFLGGDEPAGAMTPMEVILIGVGVFLTPLGMCIAMVGGAIRIVEVIRYVLAEHGN